MKPVSEKIIDEYEAAALEGLALMRAAMAYQGNEPRRFQQAKIGMAACNNYVRLRATETNRMAVEEAIQRRVADEVAGRSRELVSGE